jgi:hypothetical protein
MSTFQKSTGVSQKSAVAGSNQTRVSSLSKHAPCPHCHRTITNTSHTRLYTQILTFISFVHMLIVQAVK